jgi:hypothetical protein
MATAKARGEWCQISLGRVIELLSPEKKKETRNGLLMLTSERLYEEWAWP